jgi:Fic family protein
LTVLEELDLRNKEISNIRPFEGVLLKQIYEYFKIQTTYSSNAIEGNTLTLSETELIIKNGITVGGHPVREILETIGHVNACNYMFNLIQQKK